MRIVLTVVGMAVVIISIIVIAFMYSAGRKEKQFRNDMKRDGK